MLERTEDGGGKEFINAFCDAGGEVGVVVVDFGDICLVGVIADTDGDWDKSSCAAFIVGFVVDVAYFMGHVVIFELITDG